MFELIQDGGFGNKLTIEDGAVLELGRFEHGPELSAAVNNQPEASQSENVSNERKTTGEGKSGYFGAMTKLIPTDIPRCQWKRQQSPQKIQPFPLPQASQYFWACTCCR